MNEVKDFDRKLDKIKEEKSFNDAATYLIQIFNKNRLNETDFISEIDGYRKKDIDENITTVNFKRKKYLENEEKFIAEALEASIYESALKNNWFKNSEITPTSIYDDIEKGLDLIAYEKSENKNSAIGITFDVTTSRREDILIKKIYRNLNNIVNNKFCQPKYVFKNTKENQQLKLPVCIFACGGENTKKLIEATYKKDTKIQSEYYALFSFQLKLFIDKAIKLSEDLKNNSKIHDIKIKAIQSLFKLSDVKNYLDRSMSSSEVPEYLMNDITNQTFIRILEEEGQIILKNSELNESVKVQEAVNSKKKRPRITR